MHNLAVKFLETTAKQSTKAAVMPLDFMLNILEDKLKFANEVTGIKETIRLMDIGVKEGTSFSGGYGISDYANPSLIPLNLIVEGMKRFNKGMDLLTHLKNTTESAPYKILEKIQKERDRPIEYARVVCREIPKPDWTTENEIIEIPGLEGVILRYFPKPGAKEMDPIPTIFGPPMAGHGSQIVDFKKGQSLIETAHKAGINSVFVLDWQSAKKENNHETIDDYILKNKTCVDVIRNKFYGERKIPMNFYGFCQNGWQMTMYAAKFPEDIHALVSAGAPIDPRAGNSDIKMYCNLFPESFFKSLIDKDGLLDGRHLVSGFIMMDPVGRVKDFVDLSNNIYDTKKVDRFESFSNWYHYNIIKIPGAFFDKTVREHFIENKLVKGKMEILGEKLDLEKIGPYKGHVLATIGGTMDNITDAIDNHCLADYVSGNGGTGIKRYNSGRYAPNNSEEIKTILHSMNDKVAQINADEGHLGLFISKKTLESIYTPLFTKINEISNQRRDIA